MTFSITIQQSPAPVGVTVGESILDAALRRGVAYPHGCKSGTCGACKSRLVAGTVTLAPHSAFALTAEDQSNSLVLACRATPTSDIEIAWLTIDDAVIHPLRRLDCVVFGTEALTHDIQRIRLKIESGGPFGFSAGQFASVSFENQPARDYSMANRPVDRVLEFHVRRVEGGTSSVHAAGNLAVGDPVTVKGPYGDCWLRQDHTGPILAVAGGSGLAPMKSIIETALARRMKQPIHLYFAVTDERDLYMEHHFRGFEARFGNFSFTPVLANPSVPSGRRTGFAHDAVLADHYDFDGVKIHAAGPPAMVEALTEAVLARGARVKDVHADLSMSTRRQ